MKTTIEISEALLEEARTLAAKEHSTIRALVDEGLRKVVEDRKRGMQFKLRRATFRGKGLRPEMTGASWQQIRDSAYEGRGA